ncbi:RelA/SpoT domain-containing protein [Flavobacteriaceae bacterium F89]|uniref:RelA/SpoT domain-containing protein n=1 Tax=Cerina litoralis TaxID=2874477 RepID=A0AAE3EXM0_9FLAO|nr:RelA/SpoT domain-containing protein [Cerina litoralis]MCG2461466.1 RelA/SpoT domain-containing protein [Cerina litoralis]
MIAGFQLIEEEICQKIKDELDKIGIHYRIFSRSKDEKSIREKITRKAKEGSPYHSNGKLIQDIIGIRVVTYFRDDVNLVKDILSRVITFKDEEIDSPELTVFKPKRTNIICSFNESQSKTFSEVQLSSEKEYYNLLDSTFELQLRTILSEGWHEIDHSLRYKCKEDWEGHYDNERLLNGIYASLETNDIALKNLFTELAYKHFKSKNWEGLIRNKFRLRFQLIPLKEEVVQILNEDLTIGKELFKLNREASLMKLYEIDLSLPVNMNNIIFLLNGLLIKNEGLLAVTPDVILKEVK